MIGNDIVDRAVGAVEERDAQHRDQQHGKTLTESEVGQSSIPQGTARGFGAADPYRTSPTPARLYPDASALSASRHISKIVV